MSQQQDQARTPSATTSRLPRFKRARNPPRMVFTERDGEILRQIHVYRLLTREQVERLVFPPADLHGRFTRTDRARTRLRLLYHHGYVDRIPMPVGNGAWSWRPVYRLARKGAQVIAAEQRVTEPNPHYWGKHDDVQYRRTKASTQFLEHTLAINDVRIMVMRSAQAKGWTVEKWLSEHDLRAMAKSGGLSVTHGTERTMDSRAVPDAYFVLRAGDKCAHFFLEVDRATMSATRWQGRVRAFLDYVNSGRYEQQFGTYSLRILTVTTTRKRLGNLQGTTARVAGASFFWFAILSDATSQDMLLSPIWSRAGDPADAAALPLIR